MKHRIVCIVFLLLVCAPSAKNQDNERRDGNWWTGLTRSVKLNYMTGFFDGMALGNRFSYWGMTDDIDHSATAKTIASYASYSEKYFSEVTNAQLVDGLDKLYSDFRNRRIDLMGGVWLVLNSISGKSEAEMEKMTENWRKNAVPPNQ